MYYLRICLDKMGGWNEKPIKMASSLALSPTYHIEQVGSGGTDNGSDLCWGGAQFESWLRSLLKLFTVFLGPSMEIL
jgi:hypothetical protein